MRERLRHDLHTRRCEAPVVPEEPAVYAELRADRTARRHLAGMPDLFLKDAGSAADLRRRERRRRVRCSSPITDYKAIRAKQFNVVLEKELSGNVVTVGYIGLAWRSHQPEPEHQHARAGSPANVQPRRPYFSQYPNLTNINMISNLGERNYNAMQMVFQRR